MFWQSMLALGFCQPFNFNSLLVNENMRTLFNISKLQQLMLFIKQTIQQYPRVLVNHESDDWLSFKEKKLLVKQLQSQKLPSSVISNIMSFTKRVKDDKFQSSWNSQTQMMAQGI